MRTRHNVVAGLVASGWGAVLSLAMVPVYLYYLGSEAYGLVGVLATLQGLFVFVNVGLSQTMNRETARAYGQGDVSTTANLLRSFEYIYWALAVGIALVLMAAASALSSRWLNFEQLSPDVVKNAVTLIGIVVASRLPIGLYIGALSGAQRLVALNVVEISVATFSSLGAVLCLTFVAPSILVLFSWQAAVALGHAGVLRYLAWKTPGQASTGYFDVAALRAVWSFSGGAAIVTLLGILLTQIDKVLLSNMLSLEAFGYYTLAGNLARVLTLFVGPIFNVVFPWFSSLVAAAKMAELTHGYRLGSRALAAVVFPLAAVFAVFSPNFLQAWTGSSAIADEAGPAMAWIAVGYALNGVMHFPYALQLAFGNTRLPTLISSILAVVVIPLTIVFTLNLGMLGGAMAGCIMNVLYLFLGTWLTHRALLRGIGWRWLALDIGVPAAISAVFAAAAWHLQLQTLSNSWALIAAALIGVTMLGAIVLTSPGLRQLRPWSLP
jgi:O-antigen/teichoic acid export membrane protein